MAKKYAIWNKKDPIITPIGEVLSAEEWIKRYPVAGIDTITVVCSAGEINGGFFGTLGQMKLMAENNGATFEDNLSNEELLAAIEKFENELHNPTSVEPTAEERIAAALEYQNMMAE